MKANEAPEKLYLNQDDGLIWHCRSYKDDIEYTRTDAFMKKAKSWFIQQHTGMWNEFKSYMKGE